MTVCVSVAGQRRTHVVHAMGSKYDLRDGRKSRRMKLATKFVIGLLVFVFATWTWTSLLPTHALPGARRGDFRPSEVSRGKDYKQHSGHHGRGGANHVFDTTTKTHGSDVFGGFAHGSRDSKKAHASVHSAFATAHTSTSSSGRKLILASHGRLMWLDVDTRATSVIHEGRGVYYGMFPADESGDEIWVVSRPHNWRPTDVHEALLKIDLTTNELVDEIEIPTHFTHDAVRHGDLVFVADTGGGGVTELSFPSLKKTGNRVDITTKEHVNTLAPVGDPDNPHLVWALLHNLGPSKLVLLDLQTNKRVRTISEVGNKAHGLVPWKDGFIILNSGEGSLCLFTPPDNAAGDKSFLNTGGALETLWTDPHKTFMKGLTVIEDVVYFGIAEFGGRQDRDDASKTAEVGAFDLVQKKFLWRTTVETKGLLNIVAAPHVSEHSTYFPVASWGGDGESEEDQSEEDFSEKPHLGDSTGLDEHGSDLRGHAPELSAPSGVPWIDLRQKSHLTSNKDPDLLIQHTSVVIDALRAELQSDPTFCQKSSQEDNASLGGRKGNMDQFKPGVDSAILIFSDYNGKLVFKFPWYDKYEPLLAPILEKVLRGHFGLSHPMRHVIRLQFACMNPGSKILKHTDRGGWVKNGHRIHIPLIVPEDSDVQFVMIVDRRGDVDVPLVEGNVFEINNNVPHRVNNDADSWRVHLLLDFTEDETPESSRFALNPGQTCEYHGLDDCTRKLNPWPWYD